MTNKLLVLVGQRRYQNAVPMATVDLSAFITFMEKYAVDQLGVGHPSVTSSESGNWIKFEFEMGDDD